MALINPCFKDQKLVSFGGRNRGEEKEKRRREEEEEEEEEEGEEIKPSKPKVWNYLDF